MKVNTLHSNERKLHLLPLSDEEALALLELCIYSGWENEPVKDKVMHKLADICKRYECEAAMLELAENKLIDEHGARKQCGNRHSDDKVAQTLSI